MQVVDMFHYQDAYKVKKHWLHQLDEKSVFEKKTEETKKIKKKNQIFTSRRLPLGLLNIATRPSSAASHSRLNRIPSCVYLHSKKWKF